MPLAKENLWAGLTPRNLPNTRVLTPGKNTTCCADTRNEIFQIKMAIADILEKLPKKETASDLALSAASNTAAFVCSAGTSALIPGVGQAVKSGLQAASRACVTRYEKLKPLQKIREQLLAILKEEIDLGGGREGGLAPDAYGLVSDFLKKSNLELQDFQQLKADLAVTRNNSGFKRQGILQKLSNLIRRIEKEKTGGRKKTAKQRKLR